MIQLESRLLALSEGAFAREIIDDLHKEFGVDLLPTLTSPLAYKEKKQRSVDMLLDGIFGKAKREGYLEDWQQTSPNAADEDAAIEKMLDDVDIEPNYSIIPSDLSTILSYRGNAVKDYVYTLTKRFENAAKAKTAGQAAIEIVGGGVIGVGVPAAKLAIQAYRAGGTTILNAARTGITSIGLKTAIGVIVVVLVGLLLFLLFENPKKVLGVVINDTDENLNVKDWRDGLGGADKGDLFMAHGQMKSFMSDHPDGLSSPEVQVRSRIFFDEVTRKTSPSPASTLQIRTWVCAEPRGSWPSLHQVRRSG